MARIFEPSSYVKFAVAGLFISLSYNYWIAMRRTSELTTIQTAVDKREVLVRLGEPSEIFNCATGVSTFSLFGKDQLCQGKASEVYTFPRCYISIVCPGWNYVVFDETGRPINKFEWIIPIFQSNGQS